MPQMGFIAYVLRTSHESRRAEKEAETIIARTRTVGHKCPVTPTRSQTEFETHLQDAGEEMTEIKYANPKEHPEHYIP